MFNHVNSFIKMFIINDNKLYLNYHLCISYDFAKVPLYPMTGDGRPNVEMGRPQRGENTI